MKRLSDRRASRAAQLSVSEDCAVDRQAGQRDSRSGGVAVARRFHLLRTPRSHDPVGLPVLLRLLLVLGADREVREAVVKVALPSLKHGKENAQPSAESVLCAHAKWLGSEASIIMIMPKIAERTVHREPCQCLVSSRREAEGLRTSGSSASGVSMASAVSRLWSASWYS